MLQRFYAADKGVYGSSGVAYKDDLYEAVNGKWEKKAKIPADRAGVGGFNDLSIDVENKLISDLNKMGELESTTDKPELQEAVRFFQLALDFGRRKKQKMAPVMPLLKRAIELKDFADLNAQAGSWYETFPVPFQFSVEPDMNRRAFLDAQIWPGGDPGVYTV